MIGKTVLDLDYLPIDERQRFQEEDMRAIREVGRYSYELPIVYADGQIHDATRLMDSPCGRQAWRTDRDAGRHHRAQTG
jgi:hypothetical protein